MTLKIDAKFEGELTLRFQKRHKEFGKFAWLKKINSTFNKTFFTCLTESLFLDLRYK